MRLKPSESELNKLTDNLAQRQVLKAFCAVLGPVLMGSGLGQLFHSNYVTSAVLITISLPFISVTVVSALLNRRLRHKLELIRQQVGRLAATVTVHQVVSKLQLDASCTASLEGGSDDSS